MTSEKIRPHHLERKAILYVRQSSTHQVMHNRESGALQYAMRDRLAALGWSRIETVDDDLGRSAAGGVARAGFDRMVAEVCLGKVGAVAAREVLDQVIVGEYAIGLQIFNHHAVISAQKGAPVDWIKMEPATGTLSVISIHKNAPHPNAAKLLVDFIISKEGQQVMRDADYLTADPAVPARVPELKPEEGHFRVRFFSPEAIEQGMPKWKQIFDELFG